MSADDKTTAAAAQVAAGLPCWAELGAVVLKATTDEAVAAELELGTGRTNQNFIADATDGSGNRYFVRIGTDIPAYGVTRANEQAAGRAAAAAGIAPAVLFTREDAMVTEFCDGKTLTEAQLKAACAGTGDDVALLAEVAKAINTLHATPVPAELAAVAAAHAERWAPADMMYKWLPQAEVAGWNRLPLLEDARALIALSEAAAGQPSASVFCHYDLLPDNLIRSRLKVSVIDFEYAGAGQAFMDLAIMSMGSSLCEEEEANLLAEYIGTPPTPQLQHSFSALKVLACLRETLWGVTAEVSRASALPLSEAEAYTDENYAKLTKYRADFEQQATV
jgi:aminoglycoside phosphotransferase (APT) family kinase protein